MDLTKIQTEVCRVHKGSSQAHNNSEIYKELSSWHSLEQFKLMSISSAAAKPKGLLLSYILYYCDRTQNITGPNLQKVWLPHFHTNSFLVHLVGAGHWHFYSCEFLVKLHSLADCENQLFEVSWCTQQPTSILPAGVALGLGLDEFAKFATCTWPDTGVTLRHNPKQEGSQGKMKHSTQSRVTETSPEKPRDKIFLVLMPLPM